MIGELISRNGDRRDACPTIETQCDRVFNCMDPAQVERLRPFASLGGDRVRNCAPFRVGFSTLVRNRTPDGHPLSPVSYQRIMRMEYDRAGFTLQQTGRPLERLTIAEGLRNGAVQRGSIEVVFVHIRGPR